MSMHNLRTSGSAYPFILYILFVTVYLGAQMFQGFSWLDIGFYSDVGYHIRIGYHPPDCRQREDFISAISVYCS